MKRTSLMLPADLKAQASHRARADGISLGQFIRQAMLEKLQAVSGGKRKDILFEDRAVYAGEAPENLARDHDQHLYGEGA